MKLYNKYFVLIICVTGLLVVSQIYITNFLLKDIQKFFNFNENQSISLGVFFGISYAFGFLIFRKLPEKINKIFIIYLCLILLGIITLLISYIREYNLLIVTRIFQGLIASLYAPSAIALITETTTVQNRLIGISGISFAFLISGPFMQNLIALIGLNFSLTMKFHGILYIAMFFLLFLIKPCYYIEKKTLEKENKKEISINKHLLITWLISLSVLFLFVAFNLLFAAQFTAHEVFYLRLILILGFLFCFLSPKIINKIKVYNSLILSFFLISISFLCYSKFFSLNIFCGLMISIGTSLAVPCLVANIALNTKQQNRASAISVYSFFLFMGAGISPYFFKVIQNNKSIDAKLIYLVMSTSILISLVFIINRKRVKYYLHSKKLS